MDATFLIGLGGFKLLSGSLGIYAITELILLLVISAIATGIIIYANMSIQLEYNDYNKETKEQMEGMDAKHSKF